MGRFFSKPVNDESSHFGCIREAHRLSKACDHETAVVKYTKAIEMNSSYFMGYYGRAQSYRAIGRHQDAINDLNVCLELSPSFHSARVLKVECYEELEEYDLAVMERTRLPPSLRGPHGKMSKSPVVEMEEESLSSQRSREGSFDSLSSRRVAMDPNDDDEEKWKGLRENFQRDQVREQNLRKFFDGRRQKFVKSPLTKEKDRQTTALKNELQMVGWRMECEKGEKYRMISSS